MRISLLAPTRARPNNMQRLWDSIEETADNLDNIEIVFYLDDDDEAGHEKFLEMSKKNQNIIATGGARLEIGSNMWNEAYTKATGEIIMLASDDIVFRTPHWDTTVIGRFHRTPDRIRYVWGNDGWKRFRRWGTHGFIHRNWVNAVGYFVPPLTFYGMDDWFTVIAKKVGRADLLEDMLIEHLHVMFQKTEESIELAKKGGDETYIFRHRGFQKCVKELRVLKKESEYSPSLIIPKLIAYMKAYKAE